MKTLRLTLFITLLASFAACKKDKKDDEEAKNNRDLTAELLLEAPAREQANHIAASMDGKYLYTAERNTTAHARVYFSKDKGTSWDILNVAPAPNYDEDLRITKGGFTYIDAGRKLYNLNNGQEVAIDFFGTVGIYDWYCLGEDDYIYFRSRYFKKITETVWDTLPLTADFGSYVGQDVTGGGAAFYNVSQKKLNIHNPANNTITTYDINIDVALVSEGPAQPNRPPRYLYNGSDKFAIAYTKGVAVQDLASGSVAYTNWGAPYQGYYLNPVSVSIDKEGVVYAALWRANSFDSYKVADNKLSRFYARVVPVSRNEYTYYIGTVQLHRISKAGEDRFHTYYAQRPNAEKAQIESARVVGGKTYALLQVTSEQKVLHTYSSGSKEFTSIARVSGRYNFIYSEGNNMYVYGQDSIMHSSDNGTTWTAHPAPTGNKSIRYITKSGGTYYGLHYLKKSYNLGGTGFSVPQFDMTTYSSSDALNWIEIASLKDRNGNAPEALTPDGYMMYSVNLNPQGNANMQSNFSTDYGATWTTEGSGKYFNGFYNNELYTVNYNGNGVDIIRYDRNFNQLSSQKTHPSSSAINMAGVGNIHFDADGRMYCNTIFGFYRVIR